MEYQKDTNCQTESSASGEPSSLLIFAGEQKDTHDKIEVPCTMKSDLRWKPLSILND